METLEITIKKPYAKQVIDDLVAMDAIEMVNKSHPKLDAKKLWGSWKPQSREQIDLEISKMRDEWEKDI